MLLRRLTRRPPVSPDDLTPVPPGFVPTWNRVRTAMFGCFLVAALTAFGLAGPSWGMLLYRLATDGLIAVLWVLGAAGLGGLLEKPLGFPRPPRAVVADDELPAEASRPKGKKSGQARAAPLVPAEARAAESSDGADEPATLGEPVLRFVTAAALGLGITSLWVLLVGLLGVLRPWTAAALPTIGLIISCVRNVTPPLRPGDVRWYDRRAGWGWAWAVVMPLLAIAVVAALVPSGVLWNDEPNGYDVAEYHLQVPREWYEARRIAPLRHNVFSYMPFNVEMNYLLAMELRGGPTEHQGGPTEPHGGAWAGMYLAQYMHVGYCALFVVAVYALGGGGRRGTVAGLLAAGVPWLSLLAPIAYDEGGLLLYATLAFGWLLRAGRTGRGRHYVLAGLFAGLACGVKYPAVPLVLLAGAAAVVVEVIVRRLARSDSGPEQRTQFQPDGPTAPSRTVNVARRAAVGVVLFLLAGTLADAPWLVRNAEWSGGNPVFPEAMRVLGKGHFAPVQVERWERAYRPETKYASARGRVRALAEQVVIDPRYGYALIPAGVVAAFLARRARGTATLVTLGVALVVVWCGFTHVQSRFFVLVIPIVALLVAQTRSRDAQRAIGAGAALVAALSFFLVGDKLRPLLEQDRDAYAHGNPVGLLGVESLTGLRNFDPKTLGPDERVALVGDACAFWYQVPMDRLAYKTVFDVDTTGATDPRAAWLAGDFPPGGPRPRVVTDEGELRRLTHTYYGFPPVVGSAGPAATRPE